MVNVRSWSTSKLRTKMCSSPKAPSMPDPQPLPDPAPIPSPQQARPTAAMAPPPVAPPVQRQAPLPKQVDAPAPTPPPTLLVQGQGDIAPVKRRKSKRREVQQASRGTAALTIPLNTRATEAAGGNTGGLNIPT
uniref:Uncharacterized protein n=1 Tax=uncultured marine virus TaxID=186617 RepID=A0A0F7LCG5_9VIRU|nr:hypothetical protein [uncultured marine virus]